MADQQTEPKLFSTFENHGQFLKGQQGLLALDLTVDPSPEMDKNEKAQLGRLNTILDEYQEQAYLLDPFLENLVVPVIDTLKAHAKQCVLDLTKPCPSSRIGRVASLLYSYMKSRGYKTIIRFFPHEIADLSIALGYIGLPNGPARDTRQWELRYVVLLWLSLICMIPFDLSQFDDAAGSDQTAIAIESVGKDYLGSPGLEREGAAVLLSRLYMRKDAISRLHHFLQWSTEHLREKAELFVSVGLLQVLAEVVKSGPEGVIALKAAEILNLVQVIEQAASLKANTLVRKYKTKLLARVALRLLPAKSHASRRQARTLSSTYKSTSDKGDLVSDIDVPEEVETVLEALFSSLQDKDTVVRWSAAKGVARIADRLPTDFATQVLDTVVALFEFHSIVAAGIYDLPAIAEATWHGACLACAELARRGLVPAESLPTLIEWLSKALYFDIRKGAHSIGSSVRDAAAYVLWALARAQEVSSIAPHAGNLARRLVTVALFDREIHIRRAASAAFQEHVGRMSLFPHGIDVLRKTDFYAVSIRRNAFAVAAPQVAEHDVYRSFLIDHIINVTLRHWDPSMRQLGSQSLQLICESNLPVLGPDVVKRVARLLASVDTIDLHGALLALTDISEAYMSAGNLESYRQEAFSFVSSIPQTVIQASRNELVTAATCRLIANSITLSEIELAGRSSVPHWREIVELGLKHRSTTVQEAATLAMAAVSKLTDCSVDVAR